MQLRLVDAVVKSQQFQDEVKRRALELAAQSDRPAVAKGVKLTPLKRMIDAAGYRYEYVDVQLDRESRRAAITVSAPGLSQPDSIDGILELGANWWPLQMARELDDAILMLRTNRSTSERAP